MLDLHSLYYTPSGDKPLRRSDESPDGLPIGSWTDDEGSLHAPDKYVADMDLAAAVNTAIILGRPLFVTGEPGTGKSELADHLAHRLDLGRRLKVEIKSTSNSQDLFFVFDSLRQFRDANLAGLPKVSGNDQPFQDESEDDGRARKGRKTDKLAGDAGDRDPSGSPALSGRAEADWVRPYLTFQGLGLAILRTRDGDDKLVRRYWDEARYGAFDGPRRSVVLIDEIDKAQRDLPNDLLNEVDRLYFRVREDEGRLVGIDNGLVPLIIFTSNSEKHLPDAFLRRCIYYHILFPDLETEDGRQRLDEIVASRMQTYPNTCALLKDAIALMRELRSDTIGLAKPPATAEVLDWLNVLRAMGLEKDDRLKGRGELRQTLGSLLKSKEDRQAAEERVISKWFPEGA